MEDPTELVANRSRVDQEEAPEAGGEHQPLIQELLRQTPEERLLGLRRAAAFFAAARRV